MTQDHSGKLYKNVHVVLSSSECNFLSCKQRVVSPATRRPVACALASPGAREGLPTAPHRPPGCRGRHQLLLPQQLRLCVREGLVTQCSWSNSPAPRAQGMGGGRDLGRRELAPRNREGANKLCHSSRLSGFLSRGAICAQFSLVGGGHHLLLTGWCSAVERLAWLVTTHPTGCCRGHRIKAEFEQPVPLGHGRAASLRTPFPPSSAPGLELYRVVTVLKENEAGKNDVLPRQSGALCVPWAWRAVPLAPIPPPPARGTVRHGARCQRGEGPPSPPRRLSRATAVTHRTLFNK